MKDFSLIIQAARIKETYYGYDEDRASVDSEGSSKISLDTTLDEDIFDEVTYFHQELIIYHIL